MTIFHALILGLLQGFTEFLPISSSGHLVLAESLLNIHIAPADMQGLNIMLHAGTLLALVLIYKKAWTELLLSPFHKDKARMQRLFLLSIATIPAGVVGIALDDWLAEHMQTLPIVALAFATTGFILLLGESTPDRTRSFLERLIHPKKKKSIALNTRTAVTIGIAQACALVPGLSRSGLTISTGRLLGLERRHALDFSFLMAVPVIAGATLLAIKDGITGAIILPPFHVTILAVVTSFGSSVIAILFLRAFVTRKGLGWFSPYLFLLSGVMIWWG